MFVHLHTHTPYSFLDGASDIETLVSRAAFYGMPSLAMTDHNSLAAVVKFTAACQAFSVRPILGAELTLEDETHLTLLAKDGEGYSNLCRLITLGFTHGGRLTPALPWSELPERARGLIALSGCRKGRLPSLIRAHRYEEALAHARELCDWFGAENLYMELQDDFTPDCGRVNHELTLLAQRLGVGVVATNNVHFARRENYLTHDLLRCVGTKTTINQTHPDRPLNSERYLKSPQEMEALFGWKPEATRATLEIAERCDPELVLCDGITPAYPTPRNLDAETYLRELTYKGAKARYRDLNAKVTARLEHELKIICEMGYADYFLMVWSVVRWARKEGIRATGRGSAADSCVAYALYLTDVDVIRRNLPFARFLAPGKMPDIDIDFPSDRRDEVFEHLKQKYGEECVGMVCTFHTYHAKGAVRDFGKALALPKEALDFLSKHFNSFMRADSLNQAFEKYAELKPYAELRGKFAQLFELCGAISEFPRHLGTHSSGIVISRVPLDGIAPLQPSAKGIVRIWTLDKDDAETLGAIKFDVLALRMLSAVADTETNLAQFNPGFQYDRIPHGDAATYSMMREGRAVGTFQFESAAQLSLAATLNIEHFEDLVAAVALIRPGPMRGNNVHKFVACRNGWVRADCIHPCLRETLAKTYGCIVFQEQVNDVFEAMTGCTDIEADKLRKSIAKHERRGTMDQLRADFVERSLKRHPDMIPEQAHLVFDQLQGWCGYGFTEGHAASFALTGYRTAYLSVHHPAAYFASMMNHQPMGFYNSNTLAAEARNRGATILPVEINASGDKCVADENGVIRLGLRLVNGLSAELIEAITAEREANGPFRSLLDFCVRVVAPRDEVEALALAGAFDDLHPHRRGLLWRIDETLKLAHYYRAQINGGEQGRIAFDSVVETPTPCANEIEDFNMWDKQMWTWRITGVFASGHPFKHVREWLQNHKMVTVAEAMALPPKTGVTVAGLNIRPHRPPTRSGRPVLFTSLEDETGLMQTVTIGEAIDTCTSTLLTSPAVFIRGVTERRGRAVSLVVSQVWPLAINDRASARLTERLATAPPDESTVAEPTRLAIRA